MANQHRLDVSRVSSSRDVVSLLIGMLFILISASVTRLRSTRCSGRALGSWR